MQAVAQRRRGPLSLSGRDLALFADVARNDLDVRLNGHRPSPYQADPVGWITGRLGEDLWSAQREIARSVVENRYTAVQSCHGIGKSYLAARLAAWWLDAHPIGDAFVVTTAPSAHQINAVLWREIRRAHANGRLPGVITGGSGGSIPEWKINGQLVAFGRKPPDEGEEAAAMQQFQGIHAPFVLAILDEACGVAPWLFNAVETITTGANDRILAIGNPDDPGTHFAEVCGPGSVWNRIKVSAFETPRFTGEPFDERVVLISPEWVAGRADHPGWRAGDPLHTSKVLGEFPDVAADSLFPPRLIERAQAAQLVGLDHGSYGVDVARYGEDETVVYRNRGGVVRLVAAVSQQDTEETADMVARILEPHGADAFPAVVDVVGIGSGVVDKLRRRGLPVIEFNGGERAGDPSRFPNKRSELFWRLRLLMEDGAIDLDPGDKALAKQLGSMRWKESAKQIVVESKDEMRRRGVKSPDRADAAAYAVWGPSRPAGDAEPSPVRAEPVWLSAGIMERAL